MYAHYVYQLPQQYKFVAFLVEVQTKTSTTSMSHSSKKQTDNVYIHYINKVKSNGVAHTCVGITTINQTFANNVSD